MHDLVRDLNHFYLQHPEFWEKDFDWAGYQWIDFSDADHSIISYLRKAEKYLAFVHNFTPESVPNYLIKLSRLGQVREVFNTDASIYGGSGQLNPDGDCRKIRDLRSLCLLSPR